MRVRDQLYFTRECYYLYVQQQERDFGSLLILLRGETLCYSVTVLKVLAVGVAG